MRSKLFCIRAAMRMLNSTKQHFDLLISGKVVVHKSVWILVSISRVQTKSVKERWSRKIWNRQKSVSISWNSLIRSCMKSSNALAPSEIATILGQRHHCPKFASAFSTCSSPTVFYFRFQYTMKFFFFEFTHVANACEPINVNRRHSPVVAMTRNHVEVDEANCVYTACRIHRRPSAEYDSGGSKALWLRHRLSAWRPRD